MTALIIFLAAWRQRHRKGAATMSNPAPQISPCEVALEHVIWLRRDDPHLTPQQAGAIIGAITMTWAEAVLAFAAAWEALPETARNNVTL